MSGKLIGSDRRDEPVYPPDTPARLLVQMHYPLVMRCAAAIMRAVGDSYPGAFIDESGGIWDGPKSR